MNEYPKEGHHSPISGYESYSDRIYVRYPGNMVYGYSYDSAGAVHVEEMKKLAEAGAGLATYIRVHARTGYFFKEDESVPWPVPERSRTRDVERAPMPPELKEFDFRPLMELRDFRRYPVEVFYSDTVTEDEKVPGLIDFVAEEYSHILQYMMRFFDTDNLPRGISIELSDRHMVGQSGTLTDSQIVDRIQAAYRNGTPDPQEIERILAERMSDYNLFGLYRPEPRHIKLFYRMFDVSKGPDYYLAQVRNTLAHELLHAMHHMDAYRTFCEDTKEAVRVKEALADFFAYYYVQDPGTCVWGAAIADASEKVAKKRLHAWERKFGGSWPYAYAIMFFPLIDNERMIDLVNEYVQHHCLEKYREVWEISRASMEEAYARLMRDR